MAAIGFTQADRALRINTPLGKDAVLLRSMSGQEAVSQLFRFQLELLSEKESLSFDAIVGQSISIHVETVDGKRAFHGFVSRFSQGSKDERFTYYRAEVVPWLWFLTRTSDCRIFQKKTAPDIIKKIFEDLGFSDFKLKLKGSFRQREYCVQYRETDFNFVSRLMEEEGIHYFFEHEQDGSKHTLVLANDRSAHLACPGQPKARCDFAEGGWRAEDVITEWRIEQEFRPGKWAHTDYNFETPSTNLMATEKEKGSYEIYDYPGIYLQKGEGQSLAKTRLEETVALRDRVSGKSNCRCFSTGTTVDVTDHYRSDMNKKWFLTAIYHHCTMGETYGSGGSDEGFYYTNTFECVPDSVPFRPGRVTPKPNVQGCQTAVVVGPAGEEIYTDKYGRVKVQFHWDREGKKNEDSSCWIRVSSPWAGKNWGAIHIPRIGHEVIIDFLEGDPDQPIIVGRVYHAENMPPWALPGKKVISGFKSNSTKGGGGYNEISMDDTKGTELIQVHAQFDQDIKVEHDERTNVGHDRTETVGHDETITIGNNRTEQVGVNESITIGMNRTEQVGANETITIGANRTEMVGANEIVTIAMTRTHTIGINDMLTIGAAQEVTVGGAQALTVGGARAQTVGAAEAINIGAAQSINVGSSQSTTVGKDQSLSVGASRSSSIAKDDSLQVGKTLSINAGDEISLTTGSASITLKKDGTIVISGKDITIKGSGAIDVKASKDITMKGQKILQN